MSPLLRSPLQALIWLPIGVFAFALALPVALGQGCSFFPAPLDHALEPADLALATGDFNGDGRDDLVLVRRDDDVIALRLSLPNGELGPPALYATGPRPQVAIATDIDADGIPDLVIGHDATTDLSVFLGQAAGALVPQAPVSTTSGARALAAEDFDRDGFVDLVALAAFPATQVAWLQGDGAGGFVEQSSFLVNAGPSTLAAGDFDGDSNPDVLGVNEVFFGDGNGGFMGAPSGFPVFGLSSVAVGDLDGDGADEALLSEWFSQRLRILSPAGASQTTVLSLGIAARDIALADLDADGDLDLVAISDQSSVYVYANDGQGALNLEAIVPGLGGPVSLEVGRFDSGPALDLLLFASEEARCLRGDGRGGFLAQPLLTPVAPSILDLEIGDIDGDGECDAAAITLLGTSLQIYAGDGRGGFLLSQALPLPEFSRELRMGDLDGDGDPDIVTVHETANEFVVFLNDGSGGLAPVLSSISGGLRDYDLLDLDGDGLLDIVSLESSGAGVQLGLRRVDASSLVSTNLISLATTLANEASMTLGDFDGDGAIDLALASGLPGTISYFPGDGLGGFGSRLTIPGNGGSIEELGAADLDADGREELIAATGGVEALLIWPAGPVVSTLPFSVPLRGRVREIQARDLDLDGRSEVLAATEEEIFVLSSDGALNLAPLQDWALLPSAGAFALADLNRDRRPNLVHAHRALGLFATRFGCSQPLGVSGSRADTDGVLRINGSADFAVTLPLGAPVLLSVEQPPTLPVPARFLLWVELGDLVPGVIVPTALGDLVLTPSHLTPSRQRLCLINGFIADPTALLPGGTAPWSLPHNVPSIPMDYRIQGIIEYEPGVSNTLATTNALVLRLR